MIISISGAACTGKTTLLEAMKSRIKGGDMIRVQYYGEFIRTIFAEHYSNKYKDFADLLSGDPVDIINIHKETARHFNEILWSSSAEILIFDRSPLDISIYMYLNLIDHLKDPEILSKYREASKYIYRCTSDFMNHNPIMYYTRPFSEEVEEDGFRPTSLINRRALELSLFDKEFLSLPDVTVLPSSIEDRINTVESMLSDKIFMHLRRDS